MRVPDPSLLLLIPAYNEEARIEPVLREFGRYFQEQYHSPFQLVVVLNGCRDNTRGVVEQVARDFPAISLLDFPDPIGKGGALIEGLKLARTRGIQRIRVFLDSELVVDQVNGRAKVGKEHIRPLHTEACSLLQEFPNIRISWVPRKWNAEADALATKALLGR